MREKKRERALAMEEESARLEEKEAASQRDQTLCEYLERSERRTDESMFFEMVGAGASAEEFLPRQRFVN